MKTNHLEELNMGWTCFNDNCHHDNRCVPCRLNFEKLQDLITAHYISKEDVLGALPKKKHASISNPDDGGSNHSFRLGYNQAINGAHTSLLNLTKEE